MSKKRRKQLKELGVDLSPFTNEVIRAVSDASDEVDEDDVVMNDDILDATNEVVKKKRKQKIDGSLKEPLRRSSRRKKQKN